MTVVRAVRTDVLIAGLILAFTALPTQLRHLDPHLLRQAFSFALDPSDDLANVVGYIPLGLVMLNRRPSLSLLIAASLSVTVETLQLFCVGRVPGISDVVTNVIGAGLGRWLAAAWAPLPERVAVNSIWSMAAGVAALAYVVSGARFTVEPIIDEVAGLWEAPPWMNTNDRGRASEGMTEAYWSFDRLDDNGIGDVNAVRAYAVHAPNLVPGMVGSALNLNGKQWLDFGNPVLLRLTGSMTLSAWVNPAAFPPDDAAIISSSSPKEYGYQLDLTPDEGPRTVGLKIKDARGHLMARYGRTPIVAGSWHHVAGVYDAAARTLDVYVDGRLDNGCLLGAITDRQQASGGHVFVGARPGFSGFEFIGAIDEARVLSRPQSGSEIRAEISAARSSGNAVAQADVENADTTSADRPCSHVYGRPPRIAGPLVALGILVVLAAAGLWRRAKGFEFVSSGATLLVASTATFWMSSRLALEPAWLPGLYIAMGGAVGLLATTSVASLMRR